MSRRSAPWLRLVVDNTETHAQQAARNELAANIMAFATAARDGHINTLAWVAIGPQGDIRTGIVGGLDQYAGEAVFGARQLTSHLMDRHGDIHLIREVPAS